LGHVGRSGNRTVRPPLKVLAIVVVTLALAAPAHAAFPGANGKIAFADLQNIYTVNPDGTGLTTVISIAPVRAGYGAVDWSPDGTRIAFAAARDPDNTTDIFTVRPDGTDVQRVTDTGSGANVDPTYSPDGTRIAYDSSNFGGQIVNFDGSRLSSWPGACCDPRWSTDGKKIAAWDSTCDDPDCLNVTNYIYIVNIDGTGTALEIQNAGALDWSPDGTKIVFQGFTNGNVGSDILVANPDGSAAVNLTNTPTSFDYDPVWSPDGTKIAYSGSLGGPRGIVVMNADGTNKTLILSGYGPGAWQPLPGSSPAPPYPTPKLASPVRMALVPVFRQCGTGGNPVNRSHAPPLATGSCPPQPSGVAHFGPQSKGTAWVATIYGDTNSANGDQADMTLRFDLSDVRTGAGADYDPSATADGTLVTRLRFTDRANGGSGTDPGTATDFDFSVPFGCTATSDPSVGSNCALDTSADAVNPGMIKENKATVLQVFRLRLNDSGANGVRGDGDDRLFATEGVFVP
jgi:hypothetical protein